MMSRPSLPSRGRLRRARASLALVVALAVPLTGAAQAIERPADRRPELPEPAPQPERVPILPPLPLPGTEAPLLSQGADVFVREFRIQGSSVFSEEELREVVAPWTGREITSEELAAVRKALTRHYGSLGYPNSGAVVPDQAVEDGVVHVLIVEGSLARIEVQGQRYYRESTLSRRIARGAGVPLHAGRLEEQLQQLQRDPRIERVEARLAPGERPGEAVLSVEIEERSPYAVHMEFSNYEPPSVGAWGGGAELRHANLLGFGDALTGSFTLTEGLRRFEGAYELPLGARGTRATLETQVTGAKVVESDFEDFELESEFQSYGVGLRHPLFASGEALLEVGIEGEWRRSKITARDDPFVFLASGAENGRATATVLRFQLDGLLRDSRQVFAARSTLSWGTGLLGASVTRGQPDGRFLSWLAQFQWARRFEWLDLEAIFRADLQLAEDALLSLEQFAIGGHASVRGYRENEVVRDQGVAASLELRIPLWRRLGEETVVQLTPFIDVGHGWNRNRGPDRRVETLLGTGVGLRCALTPNLRAQISWGHQLIDSDGSGDLQDAGVQLRLGFDFP